MSDKNQAAPGDDKSKTAQSSPATGNKSNPPEPSLAKRLYHVVGPGAITFDGAIYQALQELQLTEDDAAELGDAVRRGKPRLPSTSRRKAGRYRVSSLGSVLHGGKFHAPGAELSLSEQDANDLGDHVDEVTE